MEGDSSGDSPDVKEQGGGELDYPFGVDGVVRVLCLDRGLQALGGKFVLPDKPPVDARDACPAVYEGSVSTAFIVCEGVMSWTGICIVGEDFTNTFAQETEGRVCIGKLFLSKNPGV